MSDSDRVPLTEKDVKEYLDRAIRIWRQSADEDMKRCYVDAFQSVRTSLFGELLPLEDNDGRPPRDR